MRLARLAVGIGVQALPSGVHMSGRRLVDAEDMQARCPGSFSGRTK
jgi:hypothetical protein